jgi:hypothetical protein
MIQGFSSGLIGNRELIYETDLPSFQRDFASVKTLDHGTGPAITFTRASGATFFDASGVLQTASNDAPRFDHSQDGAASSLGLLIEEQRTNSIRNSQAGGAVVGVIGSGGSLPTNWSVSNAGLTQEIVATGTENGLNYFDLKLSGTTNASTISVFADGTGNTSVSNGQTFLFSVYYKLVAGSLANISVVGLTANAFDVSSNFLSGAFTGGSYLGGDPSPTSSLVRNGRPLTANNASIAFARPQLFLTTTTGAAIDITLRLAAPQFEQGAFPTSYIPTTTAAATRSADNAVVTPISSFYNQVEGTLFAETLTPTITGGRDIVTFNSDIANNWIGLRWAVNTQAQFAVVADNVTHVSIGASGYTAAGVYKRAGVYKVDDFAHVIDGTVVGTDTTGTLPVVSRLVFAASGNQVTLNGHIRKIAYWPKRLTNTLLQQLTT